MLFVVNQRCRLISANDDVCLNGCLKVENEKLKMEQSGEKQCKYIEKKKFMQFL